MANSKITTVKITEDTKSRLDKLKEHEKESYEETIKRAINILNIARRTPSLAARILRDIERSKNREKLIENPESVKKKPSASQNNNIARNMQMNVQRMKRNIQN